MILDKITVYYILVHSCVSCGFYKFYKIKTLIFKSSRKKSNSAIWALYIYSMPTKLSMWQCLSAFAWHAIAIKTIAVLYTLYCTILFYPILSIPKLSEVDWHDSLQLGDKLPTNGVSGHCQPLWAFSLNLHQTPEVHRCFAFLNIQQRLMETFEDKQREWILGSFHSNHRLRCYSGRQWQQDTHSSTSCPPTLPRMLPLPFLIPLSFFRSIASVQDLTAP